MQCKQLNKARLDGESFVHDQTQNRSLLVHLMLDHFPLELLYHIFGYLYLKERKTLFLTCKTLRNILCHRVFFSVEYFTNPSQTLYLVGGEGLGNWKVKPWNTMHWNPGGKWTLSTVLPPSNILSYKYVVVNNQDKSITWEDGLNHRVKLQPYRHHLCQDHWQKYFRITKRLSTSNLIYGLDQTKKFLVTRGNCAAQGWDFDLNHLFTMGNDNHVFNSTTANEECSILYTANSDISSWDVQTHTQIRSYGTTEFVQRIHLSDDNSKLYVFPMRNLYSAGIFFVLDPREMSLIQAIPDIKHTANDAICGAFGNNVFVTSEEKTEVVLKVYDTRTFKQVTQCSLLDAVPPWSTLKISQFSNGQNFAYFPSDPLYGTVIKAIDLTSLELRTMYSTSKELYDVCVDPHGKIIGAGAEVVRVIQPIAQENNNKLVYEESQVCKHDLLAGVKVPNAVKLRLACKENTFYTASFDGILSKWTN